jgi:hypothetical protein
MNTKGTPKNLVASQPGNSNALRHGAYSQRVLESRVPQIVDELMGSEPFLPTDRFVVEEIARLWNLIQAIDEDLAERGLRRRDGGARSLIELRLRASGRLERWLRQARLTPATRANDGAQRTTIVNVNPLAHAAEKESKRQPD